ncbi:hypothetical protein LCGC14_2747230 [marine sediment metagenome]|uniref:Uncharacterized protein n=1 Tax=marine sediment metagenome TaxID=412755 RepID=A0A0F8Z2X5_9ZZZZ
MHRTCLGCGSEFVEDPSAIEPASCPVCESTSTVSPGVDDEPEEEDLEDVDDGLLG